MFFSGDSYILGEDLKLSTLMEIIFLMPLLLVFSLVFLIPLFLKKKQETPLLKYLLLKIPYFFFALIGVSMCWGVFENTLRYGEIMLKVATEGIHYEEVKIQDVKEAYLEDSKGRYGTYYYLVVGDNGKNYFMDEELYHEFEYKYHTYDTFNFGTLQSIDETNRTMFGEGDYYARDIFKIKFE